MTIDKKYNGFPASDDTAARNVELLANALISANSAPTPAQQYVESKHIQRAAFIKLTNAMVHQLRFYDEGEKVDLPHIGNAIRTELDAFNRVSGLPTISVRDLFTGVNG